MGFELVLERPTLERMETKLSKVTVVSYNRRRETIALANSHGAFSHFTPAPFFFVLILEDEIKHDEMSLTELNGKWKDEQFGQTI